MDRADGGGQSRPLIPLSAEFEAQVRASAFWRHLLASTYVIHDAHAVPVGGVASPTQIAMPFSASSTSQDTTSPDR